MKNWFVSRNIFVVLLYRLLIIMLLFSLCRIGFYIFNLKMFPEVTFSTLLTIMKGGLLFDISAVLYINLIFILLHIIPFEIRYHVLYQNFIKYLFFITNSLAIAANNADFVYFRFVDKRATADIFGTFENESNLIKLFFQFQIDYWPLVIFTFFLIFLMVVLYNQVGVKKPVPSNRIIYFLVNVIAMGLIAGLVVAGARGGFRHSTRPITISNATKYVEAPRDVAIVLNTPFSIFRTMNKKSLVRYEFFDREELATIYNPHYKPAGSQPFKTENVVIIILESFAREYIGSLNKDLEGGTYTGYTPFIDSLLNYSLTFEVTIANGKKSIEAMPSVFASLPSLETPYPISHYANNRVNGLPSLLKEKGYYSAFFHGAPNGSMGFDSFARLVGFDDYFGLDQYTDKSDFDGMWGVWDEPFLQFFAEKLNEFKEPFLASVFTVSSHHPFKVPEEYKNRFKKGNAPILEVVGYSDYSLGRFFKKISEEPWFNNTIFIITADHTNESVHKEFQNNYGSYSIPIIFYKPGSDLHGIKNRIAQQIDIMPTILNYLNYDKEYIAFGNNLLDDSEDSFAFNTAGSTYHLYMQDHILEMIENKPAGMYNFKNDLFLESNILDRDPELQTTMERVLKAVIQTYNSRMIDNNLTAGNKGSINSPD